MGTLKRKSDVMKNNIQSVIKRVEGKYKEAPKPLKIKIGKILEGKIKLTIKDKTGGV